MLAYPAMKRLILALAALAALPGRAADSPGAGSFDVSLDATGVHEECRRIEAGGKQAYYWKADTPVDFNIHYDRGDEAIYPVKRDGMRGDGGTFVAKTAEDYCWMWTARGRPVKLEGQIR